MHSHLYWIGCWKWRPELHRPPFCDLRMSLRWGWWHLQIWRSECSLSWLYLKAWVDNPLVQQLRRENQERRPSCRG